MVAVGDVGTNAAPTGVPVVPPPPAPVVVQPARDEKGIKEKLLGLFNELIHVRVITVVGNVTVTLLESGGAQVTTGSDQPPLTDAIVTVFNLLDGDVSNVIAPTLKDDQAMRDFHATQVEKSMAVVPSNIAALVDFGKELITLLKS